jgi:hypothetical protein
MFNCFCENMRPENVWGPPFWFFLHTVASHYPETPNQVTKRKYYDLVQNFPLFLPDPRMGARFAELLDKYPVTPYLSSRTSFRRWTHFIHNQVNRELGKPPLSWSDSTAEYERRYKTAEAGPPAPRDDYDVTGALVLVFLAGWAFVYGGDD